MRRRFVAPRRDRREASGPPPRIVCQAMRMLATLPGGPSAPARSRRVAPLGGDPLLKCPPERLLAFVGFAEELEVAANRSASKARRLVPTIDVVSAIAGVVVPWAVLVFAGVGVFAQAGLIVVMGTAIAHAMFVGHNANHGALFPSARANQLAASLTSGVIATNAACRNRHNRWHHTVPDAESLAADLRLRVLRLSPLHQHRAYHRWQHWYIWFILPVYIGVAFSADVSFVVLERDGTRTVESRPIRTTISLIFQKLMWPALLLGPALLLHTLLGVAVATAGVLAVAGVLFAVGSAVGHLVDTSAPVDVAAMRLACPSLSRADARAARIVLTTSDTMPTSRAISWFVGWGQNHHLAHHLWPRRSPYDLPALSDAVAAACAWRGVRRPVQQTLHGALGAHFRFLKELSMP